jgi:hypothetical protein
LKSWRWMTAKRR